MIARILAPNKGDVPHSLTVGRLAVVRPCKDAGWAELGALTATQSDGQRDMVWPEEVAEVKR